MIGRIYPAGDMKLKDVKIGGPEYALQKIRQRLSFFKGEWGWDRNLGIAYFRQVLVKGPNAALIQAIYREEILKVPGIVAVPELDLAIDTASRLLSVSFSATYRDETGQTTVEGAV